MRSPAATSSRSTSLDGRCRDDVPLLAICRGAQVLNVAAGGTLVQDIPSAVDTDLAHSITEPKDLACHDIAILTGSRLATVLGPQIDAACSCRVNSRHHQSVGRTGDGLVVSARAADGVVEAIEKPDAAFCIGVQWHPENFWSPASSARCSRRSSQAARERMRQGRGARASRFRHAESEAFTAARTPPASRRAACSGNRSNACERRQLVAAIQQPPRIARHRRRDRTTHRRPARRCDRDDRLHRFARHAGARRVDDDRRRRAASRHQIVLDAGNDDAERARRTRRRCGSDPCRSCDRLRPPSGGCGPTPPGTPRRGRRRHRDRGRCRRAARRSSTAVTSPGSR